MREELEEYELEDPKLSVPFLIEMDPFFGSTQILE